MAANAGQGAFLTHHAHILICLMQAEGLTIGQIADQVGLTERGVFRILAELEADGVLSRGRQGRRNVYKIHDGTLIHRPLERPELMMNLLQVFGRS